MAKVAIPGMPVILYGEQFPSFKVLNIGALLVIVYVFLAMGRIFRQLSEKK
ncbi:hypothetical protein [Rodentibacter myodis]|uniref:hypothetical protein n=1 Tax=Rodentibacter myodis TaxID=1907939 RepID=UPI001ABFC440|nr:hypothetical protein [Rodentibacter myodis]